MAHPFLQDLHELVGDNLAMIIALTSVVAVILFGQYIYVNSVANSQANLKAAICRVVNVSTETSKKVDKIQYAYWEGAAGRAITRAVRETGELRQVDLDGAENDRRIADVFRPAPPSELANLNSSLGCPTH